MTIPNLLIIFFQINFDGHIQTVSEMTEIGETVDRVDALIKETRTFQKLCNIDIERAEDVVAIGEPLDLDVKGLVSRISKYLDNIFRSATD